MKRVILVSFLFITISLIAFGQQAIITGKVNSLSDGDTVVLTINGLGEPFSSNNVCYKAGISKKAFSFKIPVGNTPIHLSINYTVRDNDDGHASNELNRLAMDNYYIENGDHVDISEYNEKYKFRGKGALKFTIIDSLSAMQKQMYVGVKWGDPSEVISYFSKHDTLLIKSMQLMRSAKKTISDNVYNLLKADVAGNYLSRVEFINSMLPKSLTTTAENNLKVYKNIVPKAILNFNELDQNDITKLSGSYSSGILTRYKFDSCTNANKPFLMSKCYGYIIDHYSGNLRQRLLVSLIYLEKDSGDDISAIATKTAHLVNYEPFKNIINSLKSNRFAGARAYDFSLRDTAGRVHTLSEFKGNVILLDFWFTGCGICLQSAPVIEQIEEHFSGKPFVVITVSLDSKSRVWKETIKSHKYTSVNTTDLFTEEKSFNHPIVRHYFVEGCPTFILIDKEGKLMASPGNPIVDNGVQLRKMISKALKE